MTGSSHFTLKSGLITATGRECRAAWALPGPAGPAPRVALFIFSRTRGLRRLRPKGARAARLTDRRHHVTPRREHLQQPGSLIPCFLTRQMSAARHTATTTCKASPLEAVAPAWHLADPPDGLSRGPREPPAPPPRASLRKCGSLQDSRLTVSKLLVITKTTTNVHLVRHHARSSAFIFQPHDEK